MPPAVPRLFTCLRSRFRWFALCSSLRIVTTSNFNKTNLQHQTTNKNHLQHHITRELPQSIPSIEDRNFRSLRRTPPNPPLPPLDFQWATGCACLRPSKADRRSLRNWERPTLRSEVAHTLFLHHISTFHSGNYPSSIHRQVIPGEFKVYHRHHS